MKINHGSIFPVYVESHRYASFLQRLIACYLFYNHMVVSHMEALRRAGLEVNIYSMIIYHWRWEMQKLGYLSDDVFACLANLNEVMG